MEIKLLHAAPIALAILGIRKCYDSGDLSDSYNEVLTDWSTTENTIKSMQSHYNPKFIVGPKDKALIKRIIESGHESTLEHLVYTFDINGFSRDVLQEFSRHRVGVSPSIKSTRYTLKELKKESSFLCNIGYDWDRIRTYVVLTGLSEVDLAIAISLENLRVLIVNGIPNDRAKYAAPGAYKTSGQYTFNARSLRHLFQLRDSDRALWEFQLLVKELFKQIPEDHIFLYEDVLREETLNGRKG
jgi:thymidylate synthase (FAD)